MGLTNRFKYGIIRKGTNVQAFVGIRKDSRSSYPSVAVASSASSERMKLQGSAKSFSFPDALQGGGDIMDFVTWSELIYLLMDLATLAFVIMSYLNSKKR